LVSTVVVALLSTSCRDRPAAVHEQVGHNLLLVTLDTTRADHLGVYGDTGALTPAIDALAARGTLFEHAYTSCPQTLPAHATLMTGLDPPEHGLHVNGKDALAPDVPTLATSLSARGYNTAAFIAAFVLHHRHGLGRGFDVYDDDLRHAPQSAEPLSIYRPGNMVVDAALAWLATVAGQPKPFFAWVHLYDAHFPYRAHDELDGTIFAKAETYDAGVAFEDRQLGRLLAYLEAEHLSDRTNVIVIADHGEGLQDHGELEHGYLLNEEVLRVPLVVAGPDVRANQRIAALVSMIDILPTALDLSGVPAQRGLRGRSLVPAFHGDSIDSRPSYAETDLPYRIFGWNPLRSVTTPDWKYVRTTRPELYERPQDMRELSNLASTRPEQVRRLDDLLTGIEREMKRAATSRSVTLSAADKDRLRVLGYSPDEQRTSTEDGVTGKKDIKDMLAVKHLATGLTRGLAFGTLKLGERLAIARELVEKSPETASFHDDFGTALLDAGKIEDAARRFKEAIDIQPDLASARYHMGQAQLRLGKPDVAATFFAEALRIDPEFAAADLEMGNALAAQNKFDEALGFYAETVRLQPEMIQAYQQMGSVLVRLGRSDAAIEQYRHALRIRPGVAAIQFELANVLASQGKLAEAVDHYTMAIELAPTWADAENNLAVALAALGKTTEAREHYRRAVELGERACKLTNQKDAQALGTLAAAYVAAGRRNDGIATAEHALQVAIASGQSELASTLRERLERYRELPETRGADELHIPAAPAATPPDSAGAHSHEP